MAAARKRSDAYETALLLDLVVAIDEAAGHDVTEATAELASLREQLGIVTMPAVPLGGIRPVRGATGGMRSAAGDAGGASSDQVATGGQL